MQQPHSTCLLKHHLAARVVEVEPHLVCKHKTGLESCLVLKGLWGLWFEVRADWRLSDKEGCFGQENLKPPHRFYQRSPVDVLNLCQAIRAWLSGVRIRLLVSQLYSEEAKPKPGTPNPKPASIMGNRAWRLLSRDGCRESQCRKACRLSNRQSYLNLVSCGYYTTQRQKTTL